MKPLGTRLSARISRRISHRTAHPARLGVAALLALTPACVSYPERTAAAFSAFESGQFARAEQAYADPETTGSAFLTSAEAGMVSLAAGEWIRAREHLSKAAEFAREYEDRALLNPESLGDDLLSWVINEGQATYHGEGYERVMLHATLAMAYLATGDPTGAQVEVRRANALLESEEKLYEKKYVAGGLGHFLSAVSYELQGKLADAYIDYERMVDKGLAADLAGKALVRLAGELRRPEDRARFEERFGPDVDRPRDAATVVVVAGIGVGPFKRENTLTVPVSGGVVQWSVPSFQPRPQPVADLTLEVAGGTGTVRTVVVEDVARVAAENLDDRIAWLAAKSAVRAFLKYTLTRELGDDGKAIGAIAGILFTLITEHADLRAWQTLPDTWQAARVFLPSGRHRLLLGANGGERLDLGVRELVPGETMFVFARSIGTRLFAYPIGGRAVEDTPTTAAPSDKETP